MTQRSRMCPQGTIHRRDLIKASAATAAGVLAASLATPAAATETRSIEVQEHWVTKGGAVRLYVYRKRDTAGDLSAKPVLFLVHGSTFSSRGSFDLQVPGRTGNSAMDHFAGLGYDVWTMDHEGYDSPLALLATRALRTGVTT